MKPSNRFRLVRWLLCGTFFALAMATPLHSFAAQLSPEFIGRIEGLDFTIEPPGATPSKGDDSNQLMSGSRIVVRSGQARIILHEGDEILVCGAARLQLLMSRDSLTIALESGVLRLYLASASPVAVFTPQVIATAVSVGGARDATIGLDKDGKMCIRAGLGAVRVQQQFSDQTLLVPQFGALTLSGSEVSPVTAAASGCTCNLDAAKLYPPRLDVTVGAIAPSGISARRSPVPPPNAPAANSGSQSNIVPPSFSEPVYKVLMPPLRFDVSSPEPPDVPSTETILLVRTVVVHGEVVYRGFVASGKNHETKLVAAQANPNAASPPSQPGVFAKIGGFFRRLFGGKA
ncbi:MAG: hypothetical protein WAM91_18175 [Candidatus Acidiferrales bacterium]